MTLSNSSEERQGTSVFWVDALRSPGLWLIIFFYLVLGFCRLDFKSLWVDDAFSILGSSLPFGTDTLYDEDRTRPLYFWILGLWSLIGESDFFLRSLAVIIGAGAVLALYLFCGRLFDRRTAFYAALFMAASSSFIYFAQQIRFYTLLVLAAILQMAAFYYFLNRKNFWSLFVYWITVLVGLLASPTLALLNTVQALYVLAFHYKDGRLFKRYVISGALVVALISPYLYIIWKYAKTFQKDWVRFLSMPTIFNPTGTLGPVGRTVVATPEQHYLAPFLGAAIIAICIYALCFRRSVGSGKAALPLMWIAVPIIILIIASTFGVKLYLRKTFFFMLPGICLALGLLTARSKAYLSIPLLLAYLSVNGYFLYHYYQADNIHGEDWRSAVSYLESDGVYTPETKVVIFPHDAKYIFNHYAKKSHLLIPVSKFQPLPRIKAEFDKIFKMNDTFIVVLKINAHFSYIVDRHLYTYYHCRDTIMFDLIKVIKVHPCADGEVAHCERNCCEFERGDALMKADLDSMLAQWERGRKPLRWSAGPDCGQQQGKWSADTLEHGPVTWETSSQRWGWQDNNLDHPCGGYSPWFMLEGPIETDFPILIHFRCDSQGEAYKLRMFEKIDCELKLEWD